MGFRRSPETATRQGRTFRAVREYAPFHAGTLVLCHAGLGVARARERARHPAAMRHAGERFPHFPHERLPDCGCLPTSWAYVW